MADLREQIEKIITDSYDQLYLPRVAADRILALPEIADAIRIRNAYLGSMMGDLPPERVGEIMRKLSVSTNRRTPV